MKRQGCLRHWFPFYFLVWSLSNQSQAKASRRTCRSWKREIRREITSFPSLLAKSLHALQIVGEVNPSCLWQEETFGHNVTFHKKNCCFTVWSSFSLPGMLAIRAISDMIIHGAFSDSLLWKKKVSRMTAWVYEAAHRVDNERRGHLADHRHQVDHCHPLPPQGGG